MNETPDRNDDRQDDVERLLRVAGKRSAVPVDRSDRVREAVHAHWKNELRNQGRDRYGRRAAAILVAAAVVFGLSFGVVRLIRQSPTTARASIRVESLVGSAWLHTGDKDEPVLVGENISAGSEIFTAEDGRAGLRLGTGHSVRLDTGTRLRVIDDEVLALDDGAIYVDSGSPSGEARSLRVRTALGVVTELGTQYEVRVVGSSVRVRVREGAVRLQGDRGDHEIAIATELELREDGSATTMEIARHGTEWEWTSGVASLPEVAGTPAEVFLEWVAREKGWDLRYSDDELARAASEIVLGGSVEGLTVEQALEAVLPTCRMAHRVEDGVLAIEPMPTGPFGD